MNDTVASARVTGRITLDGEDIYAPSMDVVQLRARVGMVFQKPNPFPKSIYDNVAYGPRIHGLATGKADLDAIVERALVRSEENTYELQSLMRTSHAVSCLNTKKHKLNHTS